MCSLPFAILHCRIMHYVPHERRSASVQLHVKQDSPCLLLLWLRCYQCVRLFCWTGLLLLLKTFGHRLVDFRSYSIFVAVCVIISLLSTYACCASRHRWIDIKFLIRTGTYAASFFINTSPYWLRMYQCTSKVDCNVVSIPYFKRHFMFFAMGLLANGSRLPERLLPGVFDFFWSKSSFYAHSLCHWYSGWA